MSYHYSDPTRETDKYALPDIEVFYCKAGEWHTCDRCGDRVDPDEHGCDGETTPNEAGFYYWFCFPGCMPEGEPNGPYATEQAAIDAMREECSE